MTPFQPNRLPLRAALAAAALSVTTTLGLFVDHLAQRHAPEAQLAAAAARPVAALAGAR